MPHSSGGGSHHGGSHHHSHSHHSSGSGGSSGNPISKTPYPGARRYRYHHRGQTRYFYTTREPNQLFNKSRLLIGLFYLPFLFGVFVMLQPIANSFKPYDTSIIIKDEADVLGDQSELLSALNAFCEKTKIPPAVITIENQTWMNHYTSLESYAYDRYLSEFNDEMHWLIVYAQDNTSDPELFDFYWEGMQGDDTDSILTSSVTGSFTADLQLRLNDESTSVTDDLTNAFIKVTQQAEKPGIKQYMVMIGPALFMLLFIGVHAYFMLGLYEWKYRKAEPAPEEELCVLDSEINQ